MVQHHWKLCVKIPPYAHCKSRLFGNYSAKSLEPPLYCVVILSSPHQNLCVRIARVASSYQSCIYTAKWTEVTEHSLYVHTFVNVHIKLTFLVMINSALYNTSALPDIRSVKGSLVYFTLSIVILQVMVPASSAVRSCPITDCVIWPCGKHFGLPSLWPSLV